MTKIVPVIMCGGSGTRLWPLSREKLPKQFIPLFGEHSSFQTIASILGHDSHFQDLIVITNQAYRFLVAEQLDQIGIKAEIVLEPVRRDSGPAVAVAAELAMHRDPNAVVAIIAADHAIAYPDALYAVLKEAVYAAAAGYIVTLGIKPNAPATGYGYIRRGAFLIENSSVSKVDSFVEKPTEELASTYIAEGYLWNSGNFIFPASLMLEELRSFEPDMATAVATAVTHGKRDLQFFVLDEESFALATQKSIDYAVMERTCRAAVIPADIGWSDIGTWSSVHELLADQHTGNAIIGDAELMNCENVFVHSPKILTTAIGLKNVIVVSTPDSILVLDVAHSAHVKELVAKLQRDHRHEIVEHRRILRPWGYYLSVDEGSRYQVKRIVVKPGGCLSLQKHFHRAEHWIVVHGTAEVTIDDAISLVHENESIYVPIGSTHRLTNPGKINLEIIEVQTGSYLGEDDIVRIKDIYNR